MSDLKYQSKNKMPIDENGDRHGEWVCYHPNGQLHFRNTYFHGFDNGFFETYYQSGKLLARGFLNMNTRIGYWFLYDSNCYFLCLI